MKFLVSKKIAYHFYYTKTYWKLSYQNYIIFKKKKSQKFYQYHVLNQKSYQKNTNQQQL